MDLNELQLALKTPLGQILQKINQVLWVCSADLSETLYVSPAYEQIWGRSIQSLYDRPESFIDPIYSEDRERVVAAVEELLRGVEMDQEYRIVQPDGSIRWIHDRAFPLQDETGQVYCLAGIAEDITEYKTTQEALQEIEKRFHQVANNIDVVFWMCDPKTYETFYVSPVYEKISGRPSEEICGQSKAWINSIHPEDREGVMRGYLERTLHGGDYSYRIICADGSVRWLRNKIFPLRDEKGHIYRLLGTAEDITTHKQAEEERMKALQRERELSEAKSRFIAMTSHDLRTPLTTIQSSIDLLKHYNEKLSSDKKFSHLERISNAVEQMTSMVEDVLLLSEAEAGKLQFKPIPFDLVEVCRSLVVNLQVGEKKQHKITFTHIGKCTAVLSGIALREGEEENSVQYALDEKLIRYILTNIFANAFKYSPQGNTVQFDLICQKESVVFRIQDQGIGIPKKDIPRLFESFYRASNVGAIPGTGLGLAIVKHCVDLHDGEITVESVVGEGTTVTLTLPLNNKSRFSL